MADNKVNSGLLEFSEDQKVFVALDAETSEVKKAVIIDGDGVETDIQGVQPTGKKEITSTAEVNVASYATAQVVDEDLVAGNIKKDVDILGVVGSYEPEGDFYKPVINLVATGDSGASAVYNIIPTDTLTGEFSTAVFEDDNGLDVDSTTVSVVVGSPTSVDNIRVLNNHKLCVCVLSTPRTNIYTTEGDCIVKSETNGGETVYYVEVYGDCTISASAPGVK